jgi:branched-chain amino acid transport system permease protein
MKTSALKQSLQTGAVFGITYIFTVLIGFNSMIGLLIANLVNVKQTGTIPQPLFLLVYCALLGLWAGATAAKKAEGFFGRWLRGVFAGVAFGLVASVINIVLAILFVKQVDPRLYIPTLSLPFMEAVLFKLPPVVGILANFVVLLGASALGGALSGLLNTFTIKNLADKIKKVFKAGLDQVKYITTKFNFIWKVLLLAVLAVAIVLLPMKWGSYWNYVIGTVGIYVILGLGLNLIVGLSGQLVLGYIAFFAIGAYSVALTNSAKPHDLMWGFWPGLVIGVVLAALAGILLGLPLMRLRGDYLAIVTLGFGEIIRILLKSDLLTNFTGGPRGIQNIQLPTLFGREFNHVNFTHLIFLFVLLSIFIYTRLARSRTGRAWMSIREDETVAKATGVNTTQYKLLALALGAALAGLAGGIYAVRNQFTGPDEHSLMASINVLSLIIVGGMGNVPGTILGAFALKGLPEILRDFANYRLLAFGALLVFMMLARPEGLIPTRGATLEVKPKDLVDAESQEVKHDR